MKNKDIFNEAFFKKSAKKSLPQYAPVDPKNSGKFLGVDNTNAFDVTDTDEVKKRLAGTFGATFGANNLRSMASKSIKTFPILISDNVEPETVVILKRLLEEQNAEYLSLLISNQVIDISSYRTTTDGDNIAIQALNDISGDNDFSGTRIADKALRTGKITSDDLFKNMSLATILKENQTIVKTDSPIIDALCEGALITPVEYQEEAVRYIAENAERLVEASFADPIVDENGNNIRPADPIIKDQKTASVEDYMKKFVSDERNYKEKNIAAQDRNKDAIRGFMGVDDLGYDHYSKISTPNIMINTKEFESAMNRTIGEYLYDPKNVAIKDRFEKATFLLECQRITGAEYISYLTLRLGIPVSKEVREQLVVRYSPRTLQNTSTIIDSKFGKPVFAFSDKDLKNIQTNKKIIEGKVVKDIYKVRGRDVLRAGVESAAGAGIGAGIGAGAASSAAILGIVSSTILGPALLAGAFVGGSVALINRLIKNKKVKKDSSRIEGWERVEALIEAMERQVADVKEKYNNKDKEVKPVEFGTTPDITENIKELEAELDALNKRLEFSKKAVLAESLLPTRTEVFFYGLTNEMINEELSLINEAIEEYKQTPEYLAEVVTTTPLKTVYVDDKPGKNVLVTPNYAARAAYAYGSTEIDRKAAKDRRYDQPLIMSIKFRERFSDGTYSDNELVATIGILGKVIRIPSDEMKYILTSNSEGETLYGFLKGSGDIKGLVSDLLSTTKLSNDIKNLKQSGDVWKNLEKVATLAAANKLAGKKTNNISNAHIVFSQKEIDDVRSETGIDYLRNMKLVANLMKRYSAFTVMIANDPGQKLYICDDVNDINWDLIPYSAIMDKNSGDQMTAALARLSNRL